MDVIPSVLASIANNASFLNSIDDAVKRLARDAEAQLSKAGVGLSIWIPVAKDENDTPIELGYTRCGSAWTFAVREQDPDPDLEFTVRPLSDLSRQERTIWGAQIPKLLKAIDDELKTRAEAVKRELGPFVPVVTSRQSKVLALGDDDDIPF
ncbi:hypothetical protein LLG88_08535 [bacterium]|nr:hypothetical protein [bacterium]